ncbi:MAG: osmosensitive channel Signal transduction histidine kinase [Rickettsiales bacterium]|jgi:two-component system sensor histidine kinase KdpD|nr:osmosensitive channel Signal transduction histidine kinase [Rickettsiales bacterium]
MRNIWNLALMLRPVVQRFGGSIVALFLASVVSYIFILVPDSYTEDNLVNIGMLYIIVTVYASITQGLWVGFLISMVGFGLYQLFFHHLVGEHTSLKDTLYDLLNLVLFIAASLVAALIGAQSKSKLETARERRRTTFAFSKLYGRLILCHGQEEVVQALGEGLSEIIKGKVYLFLPNDKGVLEYCYPGGACPERYKEAAERVWKTGVPPKLHKDDPWPFFYCVRMPTKEMPTKDDSGKEGILGVEISEWTHHTSSKIFIHTLADQAAMAIERIMLADTVHKERMEKEQETIRSALLASVTHDLKTPLASVIGSLSSIRYVDSLSKEAQDQLLVMAHEEAERLNKFINNILHMTRLESGGIKLDKDWQRPTTLVHQVLKRMEHRTVNHKVLVNDAAPGTLFLMDTGLVEQIMQNLVDNAVKYGAPQANITIEFYRDGDYGCIAVSNEGTGILSGCKARVFDKFYRSGKGDKHIAGTGLGLTICRAIMDLHGGMITLTELYPGAREPGAKFILSFPAIKEEEVYVPTAISA